MKTVAAALVIFWPLAGLLGLGIAWALNRLAARIAIASITQERRKRRASNALAAWCGCFVLDNSGGAR